MFSKKRTYGGFFVAVAFVVLILSSTVTTGHNALLVKDNTIDHHDLINIGIRTIKKQFPPLHRYPALLTRLFCMELHTWYTQQPDIRFVSYTDPTMTICYTDGTYSLLLDVPGLLQNKHVSPSSHNVDVSSCSFQDQKQALILNPSEYLYGNRHCIKIIKILLKYGFSVTYQSNQQVNLSLIKNKLSRDIIYMNSHAGYWDIDGDQTADVVVVATGEHWTNQTPMQYPFEFEHHMIVEGIVGSTSFICFTPLLINYYYPQDTLPNSLIYMATCHACYNDSMAQAFLTAGADVYLGWSGNTAYWINSKTSVQTFKMLALDFTIHQISCFIRYGGFMNRIVHSKLVYFGNGQYRLR
ncbi:MAG: hypothetical protein QXX20_07895 [Candidatus Thermoplasmatota archaeon]